MVFDQGFRFDISAHLYQIGIQLLKLFDLDRMFRMPLRQVKLCELEVMVEIADRFAACIGQGSNTRYGFFTRHHPVVDQRRMVDQEWSHSQSSGITNTNSSA